MTTDLTITALSLSTLGIIVHGLLTLEAPLVAFRILARIGGM